ncbi:MAG: hypothetical protein KKD63_11075 [Proteobacteria bacterium]|nr:hypothetical protein [Desulfobulbaceae bacterium]MBU4153413.1 hypothetical protein [Pseudomonadota bacterium]
MLRLSTGLQNALLRTSTKVHTIISTTTISVAVGAGGGDSTRVTDVTNFATFPSTLVVGDSISLAGSHVNHLRSGVIVGKGINYIDVVGDLVDMASGATVTVIASSGGSIAGIFRNGVIRLYTGSQPASADAGETGTLLCEISLNSLAHVTGASVTNGINFGQASAGVIGKNIGETWSGVNINSGVAGWFRFYDNNKTTGLTTTAIRFDGSAATSGGQLKLSSTNLVSGVTTTVDGVTISMPAN